MSTLSYRQWLLIAGIFGIMTCGVTANHLFAAEEYSPAEQLLLCESLVAKTETAIANDWSAESAKSDVPVLNNTLNDTVTCIGHLENNGVTADSIWLRERMQLAIEKYMENESQQQTAVTWILDAYSKELTESFIADASL